GRTERVGLMSELMQNLASKKAKKYMLIIERNEHFFK
ncbi:plasmid mobilization relaxosome protein MobC, partial [Enterococcus faecium]